MRPLLPIVYPTHSSGSAAQPAKSSKPAAKNSETACRHDRTESLRQLSRWWRRVTRAGLWQLDQSSRGPRVWRFQRAGDAAHLGSSHLWRHIIGRHFSAIKPAETAGASTAAAAPAEDAKIRNYAASMMKRYDKNNDGVLDQPEWSQMSGSPEKYDRNHDGKITQDELVDGLKNWNRSNDEPAAKSAGADPPAAIPATPASPTFRQVALRRQAAVGRMLLAKYASTPGNWRGGTTKGGGAKSAAATSTSSDRLPEGLPDWFRSADADADGQITMAEYASSLVGRKGRRIRPVRSERRRHSDCRERFSKSLRRKNRSRFVAASFMQPKEKTESPARQLAGFIDKFEPAIARLVRASRAVLRKRFPTAIEQVYDNYNFLAIGYCTTERTSDCIVSLASFREGRCGVVLSGSFAVRPRQAVAGQRQSESVCAFDERQRHWPRPLLNR